MISYFDTGKHFTPKNWIEDYREREGKRMRAAIIKRYGELLDEVAGCPFSAAKFMDGFRIGKAFGDSQVLESMRFEHDEKQAFMPGSLFG